MYSESQSLSHSARQNFVKKVYSTLSIQLAVTVATVLLTFNSRAFVRFQMNNFWTFYVALIGSIVTLLALCTLDSMTVFGRLSRQVPTNYYLMGVFTLLESYMVSYVCYMYTPDSVMLAASATLAATVGLTYYAMTTKEDFTSMAFVGKGMLSSVIWIVFSVSLINMLFLRSNILTMAIAAFFALVYSLYLLVDTQLILGGRHKELSFDDYILGAVFLYMDIISLFLKLLRLLGKKKDD